MGRRNRKRLTLSAPLKHTGRVDLKEVTGVDAAGRILLTEMHRAGARLLAAGVANSALITEITRRLKPRKASTPRRSE